MIEAEFNRLEGFASKFPDNRYVALEQTQKLLGFNHLEWKFLLELLSKIDFGWLVFRFGDIEATFTKHEEERDRIYLHLELRKDKTEHSIIYTFGLNELRILEKKKQNQLKINSFGVE